MKKPDIELLVGKIKKDRGDSQAPWKEPEETPKESDTSEDDGLESAADSLMSAIKNGDTTGVVDALKNFIEMC